MINVLDYAPVAATGFAVPQFHRFFHHDVHQPRLGPAAGEPEHFAVP
jgi:hypothetical protein